MEGPLPPGEGGPRSASPIGRSLKEGPGEGDVFISAEVLPLPCLPIPQISPQLVKSESIVESLTRPEATLSRRERVLHLEVQSVAAILVVPQSSFRLDPVPVQPEEAPATTTSASEAISSAVEDVGVEILKQDAPAKPVLNLKDFDVRSFEFKTEVEIATVQPKLIRVVPIPAVLPPQPRQPKESADPALTTSATPSVLERPPDAPLIAAPEAVERVRVVVEPPPPPPVARQVSMDIGDAESEVRVVIRERNGELSVQFGAATERLRENLENAAPLLMQELRRDNPQTVSLDFTSFGSATDSGRDAHQDSPRKKPLKPEAVFADMDETAYPEQDTPSNKSF